MTRAFRAPGDPMPAKPPSFPTLPGANRPPNKYKNRTALIRAAIAKAEERNLPED